MDVGDINVFYGSDGELYYQRWDGNQWSDRERMVAETVEVLSLKSRIRRLEKVLGELLELSKEHGLSESPIFQTANTALEDDYVG